MTPSRRQFCGFLAPLAVLPVLGPSLLLSERPTFLGWRRAAENPCRGILESTPWFTCEILLDGQIVGAMVNYSPEKFMDGFRAFSKRYPGCVVGRLTVKQGYHEKGFVRWPAQLPDCKTLTEGLSSGV